MSRSLKSLDPVIHVALTNFDAARFELIKDQNLSHSLLSFIEAVANGTAALSHLLQPDISLTATPDQIVRLFIDAGARARSLMSTPAHLNHVSFQQLQVTGFVTSLHVTKDRMFLDWFNATYPSGRTDDFAAISHKWLLGKKSLTADQLLAESAKAALFSQMNAGAESRVGLYSMSYTIRTPGMGSEFS
jgi:hypothetical protein